MTTDDEGRIASSDDSASVGEEILIVDHDAADLEILSELLEKAGFGVRRAERLPAAIDSALARPPRLVLMDLRMAEKHGFEHCRRLQQDERTRGVAIIFVSAVSDDEHRARGFEAGAADFISKPYQEAEVLARVKTQMELRRIRLHLEQAVSGRRVEVATEKAERRKAQEDLDRARAFTDHLVLTASVMIIGLDAEGRVTLFNPAAEEITGYSFAELRDRNWFDLLVPPDRFPEVVEEFNRLMQGGMPRSFENPIVTRDGRVRFISWRNSEVRHGDEVVGLTSFGIDITEKKEAEEGLRQSEEKFRMLMEQSPLSIQILDPEGRITKVNRAWMDFWKIPEEALPEVLEKYCIFDDEEARKRGVMPIIERAFKGEAVELPVIEYSARDTMGDLGLPDVDAATVWMQLRMYPVKDDHGKVLSVVAIEDDITERRLAEQEVLAYQRRLRELAAELTRAENRERRRIASELHDNVGQSLAFMRMQLAAARKETVGRKVDEILADVSDHLREAVEDTRSVISDLSPPILEQLGLAAAISELLQEKIGRRHGLQTRFNSELEKEPMHVDTKTVLHRNVRELLLNVVKHAQANQVMVDMHYEGDALRIVVEDDGVGLAGGVIPAPGSGVGGFGLFSIDERMRDIGGSLIIENRADRGLRAILIVPLQTGDSA